jgi:hypothetical protein
MAFSKGSLQPSLRRYCSKLEHFPLSRVRKAHGDADNSPDDLRLPRVGKTPHLAFGIRMRNRRKVAPVHLAPTTNIFPAKFGEIRGSEAFDLLQLLNTGHAGTLSTVHASSAKQGLSRFTSCVLQSGIELPYRSIKTNIADSLNVVIHIERRPGRRFISEVLEINSYDPDSDLFDFCSIFVAPKERA